MRAIGPGPVIDLDHNATTPLHPDVAATMAQILENGGLRGNPSSLHRGGQIARSRVEAARGAVAKALGARRGEVVFTSGGTEADNLAIFGAVEHLRRARRPHGVLTTALEHPAVSRSVARLEASGVPVIRVDPDPHGRIEPAQVADAVRDHADLGLVSLAAANHELGNAYDVAGFVAAARSVRPDVLIHTDAVQAFGKVEIHAKDWGVDLLSVSAHKAYGPRGVGALVVREGLKLAPRSAGGMQERGLRTGTEATLLIEGFGLAARLVSSELVSRQAHVRPLRAQLAAGLAAMGAVVQGDPKCHIGNTVSARFEGCDGQILLIALDLEGFAVSTGAACSSGAVEPSPVLVALGLDPRVARGALRLSLGRDSGHADVARFLERLPELVARAREGGR